MVNAAYYPLKIAVCDDEPLDCQQIEQMTLEILQAEHLACEFSTYANGGALLESLQSGAKFQLLMLDVMMNEMDGLELASALRKHGDNTAIIFISSNRELALRGYEVAAQRYLSKPLQPKALREALLHCCQTLEKMEILLPTGKGQRRLAPSELVYAEAAERVTKLFLVGQQEEFSIKISDLESLLPERQFVLCHRSYLVNLGFIRYLRRRELELTTGVSIPVSKYRQAEVQRKLMNYLQGRASGIAAAAL